jgi:hypothetical protein
MQTTHVLEVRQGVWIDEQWLKEVGLGNIVQVIMDPGEIRIQNTSKPGEFAQPSEKGWDIFRKLGNDAPVGKLDNASEDHDRYLYGKAL